MSIRNNQTRNQVVKVLILDGEATNCDLCKDKVLKVRNCPIEEDRNVMSNEMYNITKRGAERLLENRKLSLMRSKGSGCGVGRSEKQKGETNTF